MRGTRMCAGGVGIGVLYGCCCGLRKGGGGAGGVSEAVWGRRGCGGGSAIVRWTGRGCGFVLGRAIGGVGGRFLWCAGIRAGAIGGSRGVLFRGVWLLFGAFGRRFEGGLRGLYIDFGGMSIPAKSAGDLLHPSERSLYSLSSEEWLLICRWLG